MSITRTWFSYWFTLSTKLHAVIYVTVPCLMCGKEINKDFIHIYLIVKLYQNEHYYCTRNLGWTVEIFVNSKIEIYTGIMNNGHLGIEEEFFFSENRFWKKINSEDTHWTHDIRVYISFDHLISFKHNFFVTYIFISGCLNQVSKWTRCVLLN